MSVRLSVGFFLALVVGVACSPQAFAEPTRGDKATTDGAPEPFGVQTAAAAPTPQTPAAPQPVAPEPAQASPEKQGTVLFQSHGEPPAAAPEPVDPNRKLLTVPPDMAHGAQSAPSEPAKGAEFSDRERGSLRFTGYDLDARVAPATGKLMMRARVTVQNSGDAPLARIGLQVSSSLHWESVSRVGQAGIGSGAEALPLSQHLIDTDADHTGKANEALLELAKPLLPGASLTLDTFYSGAIAQSSERLTRIGATEAQGVAADWDTIGTGIVGSVWLRGFGNVLWYPVSAPQMFLGEGTRLFDAVDHMRREEQAATVRLRLRVEYKGDPPAEAYFCGRRVAFTAISDTPEEPTAGGVGVATAEFKEAPMGFRIPSLFVVMQPEVLGAPLQGELAGGEPMLATATTDSAASSALAGAVTKVAPLLQQWLGARPLSALTVLDHAGQPFEDGPLLVAPAAALATRDAEPALTASLAHAWVQTGRPWMDEGLPQFFALLQTEQALGRDAMVAQMAESLKPLTEPSLTVAPGEGAGQPLVDTDSELYYRRKAAAVWMMLREIAGTEPLELTLTAWRSQKPSQASAAEDALAFEAALETNARKDLRRFFEDWVQNDHGLPDLTLAEVSPRELPSTASGRSGGWLTTVTVTNAGGAMADVPVIVRSGSFSTTVRLQVPGAGESAPGTATARVQTESAPNEVQVNDGITPEARTSVHMRAIRAK